jgi:hypothetical protein
VTLEINDTKVQSLYPVPEDTRSYTVFSDCGRYKWLIKRSWNYSLPRLLVIGAVPGLADRNHDDPLLRKECDFARQWGYGGIYKCNVSDYNVADPKDLIRTGVTKNTVGNVDTLRIGIAAHKDVLVAWGNLDPRLAGVLEPVLELLDSSLANLYCLGLTKSGNPKQALHLSLKTERQTYERRVKNAS